MIIHEIINVLISTYYAFPLTKIQSCLSGLERGRSAWLECICLWLASVSVSQRENLQSVAWPVWWKHNQWLHLFACSTITKRVFRYLLFWRARRCRPHESTCWIPPWWTGSEKTHGLPVCMKQCLQEIMWKQNETMLVCYWCKFQMLILIMSEIFCIIKPISRQTDLGCWTEVKRSPFLCAHIE